MKNGKYSREEWLALPPKRCPGCQRVLARSEYYANQSRCKPCYSAARVATGSDSASRYERRRRELAAEQLGAAPAVSVERDGPDFLQLAQVELFPGRTYPTLSREQCGAVRRRALALFAKASATAAAADTPAEPERRSA